MCVYVLWATHVGLQIAIAAATALLVVVKGEPDQRPVNKLNQFHLPVTTKTLHRQIKRRNSKIQVCFFILLLSSLRKFTAVFLGEPMRNLRKIGRFPRENNAGWLKREGKDLEVGLQDAIKKLMSTRKRRQFLSVNGEELSGKTALVRQVVLEGDFLWNDLKKLELVCWVNAFEHNVTGTHSLFSASEHFYGENFRKFASDAMPGSILIVVDFGWKKMTADEFAKKFTNCPRSVRLLAITRQGPDACNDFALSFNVPKWTAKDCEKYSGEKTSDINARIVKGAKVAMKDESLGVKDLSSIRFTMEIWIKIKILKEFEGEEGLDADELAILWNLGKPQDAENSCEILMKCGLLECSHMVSVEKKEVEEESSGKKKKKKAKNRYFINPAIVGSINEFGGSEKVDVDGLIKEAGRHLLTANPGENVIHLLVRMKKGEFLMKVLEKISDQLFQSLCQEKTQAGADVLEYLQQKEIAFESMNIQQKEINKIPFEALAFLFNKMCSYENTKAVFLSKKPDEATALELLYASSRWNLLNLLKTILDDVKVNDIDHMPQEHFRKKSALMLACSHGHLDAVKMLLEHNANVNKTTESGKMSPLHYAISSGKEEIVNLLLEKGADVEAKNQNLSWQHYEEDGNCLTEAIGSGNAKLFDTFFPYVFFQI